ncbi:hypothetical protein L873DRAFT_1785401 [Choiromyces venosus 120613-1]|uniref:Uncharacterized protein n=1 Tax=Choiromyces venosus 120613-1 TaxID=1336337 RepID=A0A3N4K8J1_9PEZI|nr:hypothetical protein L873DRAFT_1785401 [Choiromyces venosus 120613-1]
MSRRSDTMLQRALHAQMQRKNETAEERLTVPEENKYSVSSAVFGSWERFKGGLRRSLPEWSAEVVLGERPRRVLGEIGQEGSLVNASQDGDIVESLGCGVVTRADSGHGDTTLVEGSGLAVPKPRHPLLRHTSAPNIFGANQLGGCPKSHLKGDRRAYSLSLNSVNSIFPFPSDTGGTASPPASMYELSEFLRQDLPRSRNSPETWLPCPQIPRNNPIISYFDEPAPRPKIPHLVSVTEQPRYSTNSFPSERGWWNYFYRSGGGGSSHATAQNREETTIRAPELDMPLMEHDRWSMDVEAANTPHTPLTEKALMKHQKRLRYKARMHKIRVSLRRAWDQFVDCFLLMACAIWWFISGCGCGLFGR